MALLVETFAKGEFKTIVLWKFLKGPFFLIFQEIKQEFFKRAPREQLQASPPQLVQEDPSIILPANPQQQATLKDDYNAFKKKRFDQSL